MPTMNFFYSQLRGPNWDWISAQIDRETGNRINITTNTAPGGTTFRGGGGADLTNFSFFFEDERYSMSAIMWFWLPEAELLPGLYTLRPFANLNGRLRAHTRGRSVFEEPVLIADMNLGYKLILGGTESTFPTVRHSLVNLHRRSNVDYACDFVDTEFTFWDTQLVVPDPADLVLELRIELQFWRDAIGNFFFLPIEDDPFFTIEVPRWQLGFRPLNDPGILI